MFCFNPVSSQNKCSKYYEGYIPKDLMDALNYMNYLWPEEDKEMLKKNGDNGDYHFGFGLYMRNNWGLWAREINSLKKQFLTFGIYSADDMSEGIIDLFYRYLNNIDVEKEIKDRARQAKEKAKAKYKERSVGDTIKVPFVPAPLIIDGIADVRLASGEITLLPSRIYRCLITGVIVKKKEADGDYILTVRVIDKWFDSEGFYKLKSNMEVGELFEHNLSIFPIIPKKQ